MTSVMGDSEIRDAFKLYSKKVSDITLIDELDLNRGKARVDLIHFGSFVTGYEIKSDKDTLERLVNQAQNYNRALEKIYLITGGKHKDKVSTAIPSWWGIILASPNSEGIKFRILQDSQVNPYFDPGSLLDLLWRDELLQMLEFYGINKGVDSKSKYDLKLILRSVSPYMELKSLVTEFMNLRKNRKPVPQLF